MASVKPFRLGVFLGFTLMGVCYTLFFFPFPLMHQTPDYHALLLFFIISVLIYCYPVKYRQIYLTFTLLPHLFIFVQFGFLAEMVISQFGLLMFILFSKKRFQVKYILFHAYIFLVSLFSAIAYHLTLPYSSDLVRVDVPINAIISYILIYFFTNHIMLNWTLWIRQKRFIPFEFQEVKWTMLTILLSVPISILLLVVYQSELGLVGTVIVAIPALITVYIFKLLNDVEHVNNQLKVIHDVTSTFTSELDVEKNLNALMAAIKKIQPYDICYLFKLDHNMKQLEPVRFDSSMSLDQAKMYGFTLHVNEGISGQVAATGKPIIIHHEPSLYFAPHVPEELKELNSVLSVPLQTKDKILGVLFIGRYRDYGFSKKDLTLIEILANHAATSMENAYIFQQTERRALIDELTGLYNYRGFELQLEQKIDKAKNMEQCLAMIIIDIDHFKKINDQFGHLMGNKVLQHIADVIKDNVRKDDIVCRYGGEEFTIILPNTSQSEAVEIAERIRESVPANPIKLQKDLGTSQEIFVQSTISVGIAIFPEHAEDALSIVRHADRAMYVGAKQAGRNRVSMYDVS